MIKDWWDRQSEQSQFVIAYVGAIFAIMVLVGVPVFGFGSAYEEGYNRASAKFHREAVESGHAHWVLGSDGQPEFRWKGKPE